MKILWHSNAPHSPTGYGVQTDLFVKRLINNLGHDVIVSAFYGLQGAPMRDGNLLMLPAAYDAYGQSMMHLDFDHYERDALITLMDVWVLDQNIKKRPWFPWVPIDHMPAPPAVVDKLRLAAKPIAMSLFGQIMMQEQGIESYYVPHGVDCDIYKPYPRAEARKRFGIEDDTFLVALVAANKGTPSRKAFEAQFRAFAQFHRKHPNSVLYVHSEVTGALNGEPLAHIAESVNIPQTALRFCDQYQYIRGMYSQGYMAQVFSAADVLMHGTRGEGFGVTQIEAMACGCPVIVTDFSAMSEIVRNGKGWAVKPLDVSLTEQGAYMAIPNVAGMVEALEYALAEKGNEEMRAETRNKMLATYEVNLVIEKHWKPVLDDIALNLGVK